MKTAVEWLADQLKKQGFLYDLDIEAAKEKEKEQIIEAHADGAEDLNFNGVITERGLKNGEYYYNQTYNQNK